MDPLSRPQRTALPSSVEEQVREVSLNANICEHGAFREPASTCSEPIDTFSELKASGSKTCKLDSCDSSSADTHLHDTRFFEVLGGCDPALGTLQNVFETAAKTLEPGLQLGLRY